MTPQNPEELSIWLAVFKSRVRDGLLFESAEDEANAALAEHRGRTVTQSPVGAESSSDPSLTWLAEVMRHAPPPEHSMPYGAYMQTVRDLMRHKAALADVQREYDELVKQHAREVGDLLAKRSAEETEAEVARGDAQRRYSKLLRDVGKLHDLLSAARSYVAYTRRSEDSEAREQARTLLHEIDVVISPTLIALPNDGE